MSGGPVEVFKSWMNQQQKAGNLILPGELVRRVKSGAGLGSLGEAQHVSMSQASEQQGIESDTRAIVGRLEAAWSRQGGDAARAGLQPLAAAATSSSSALSGSQGTLSDQSHAFQSTRDSLQDVSDWPPTRDAVDVVTPWDTDTEDQINQRNAAVQRNKEIYQGFTSTSDGHAQAMPTEYGQMSDANGDFTVGIRLPQRISKQPMAGTRRLSRTRPVRMAGDRGRARTTRPSHRLASSTVAAARRRSATSSCPLRRETATTERNRRASSRQRRRAPGAVTRPDLRRPVRAGVDRRPTGPGTYPPAARDSAVASLAVCLAWENRVPADARQERPGGDPRANGLGGAGRSTGSGRLGGAAEEPVTRGGAGAAGARGANGMPMGAGAGKGGKEEDKEKKSASYLLEPDPNALFGYGGKATPPVIGK